ncbi:hypothetical protein OVS_04295 [Mycoplasma ovis str. Michigan]|uniref:Uncharacterized protein n=1 Tax=Mycoplasma ovis str. Michigan TaxID=1415773 RepID=A0ABM5P2M7_9MOLU|nr:hypothetical protein [Mycoplasma ovis]AHC40586.1 hypothetical protein OVS_04295 [Mycoplasma ovis str. Michigan]
MFSSKAFLSLVGGLIGSTAVVPSLFNVNIFSNNSTDKGESVRLEARNCEDKFGQENNSNKLEELLSCLFKAKNKPENFNLRFKWFDKHLNQTFLEIENQRFPENDCYLLKLQVEGNVTVTVVGLEDKWFTLNPTCSLVSTDAILKTQESCSFEDLIVK